MAGVLVRLKLRVLLNSLRGVRAVGTAIGAVLGLIAAAVCALVPPLLDETRGAADLVALFVAMFALGWIAGPVLAGGDETVRPENFALLPVRPTALARGMLAASLVGVAPVVTLVAFSAHLWVGLRGGVLPAVVGIVAAAGVLGLVVLVSRVAVAALSAVVSSRRGRDVGIVLASLLALAFLPINLLLQAIVPALVDGGGLGTVGTVLRAVPTGWGAVAVESAVAGDVVGTFAPLLGLGLLCALLVTLWGRLLERRLTTAAAGVGPTARRARPDDASTTRRSPVGAVVSRELKLWWRDARRRSLLATALLLGLVLPFFASAGSVDALAYGGLWVAVFASVQLGNLYGLDGAALRHLLVVGDAAPVDVRGRQLAWLLLVVPAVLVAAVAGSVVATTVGTAELATSLPWLMGLLPVVVGTGCGLVVLQSVYVPIPQPQGRDSNPFSAGSGQNQGCTRALASLAFLLLLVPPVLPVLALLITGLLTGSLLASWAAAPIGLATGCAVAWWWGKLAVRRLRERGPEILAEVARST